MSCKFTLTIKVVILVLGTVKERSLVEGIEDVADEVHSHTHQSRVKTPWYIA